MAFGYAALFVQSQECCCQTLTVVVVLPLLSEKRPMGLEKLIRYGVSRSKSDYVGKEGEKVGIGVANLS